MSFQPYHNHFASVSVNSQQNHSFLTQRPSLKINHNYNYMKPSNFDFEISKAFVQKEKQWFNSMKNNKTELMDSVDEKTVGKLETPSLVDQRKNHLQTNMVIEQNLAKTVKPTNFSYKKSYQETNQQRFKQQLMLSYGKKNQNQNVNFEFKNHTGKVQTEKQNDQKLLIMSIDQIREIEKRDLADKTIHKITSSASRQKLKTSSSKDSKGSLNTERKSINLNGNTERYSKYINEGLINVNIDIRKQISQNIVAPNLNVRKFGPTSQPGQLLLPQTALSNYPPSSKINETPRNLNLQQSNYMKTYSPIADDMKFFQNQSLTCRQSIPREDNHLKLRIKSRSKSNLSKYSQLKEIPHSDCLVHCEVNNQLPTSKEFHQDMHKTPQKGYESGRGTEVQKEQKKIHVLSYSSTKSKVQRNIGSARNLSTLDAEQKFITQQKRDENIQNHFSCSGTNITQDYKYQGAQTERRHLQRGPFVECQISQLGILIEQKMKRKPIRLTMHKRN